MYPDTLDNILVSSWKRKLDMETSFTVNLSLMHFHNLFFLLAALYDICDIWLFNTKCDLHKAKLHNPLAEDKIEVKDKDLFSYLYSEWLQSDGFCGLL